MKGLFTALVTPFKADLSVDEEALKKIILHQIAAGVSGIVSLGTTGETPTLLQEEQERILSLAVQLAKGKTKIIAGTGSYSTERTIFNTKRAADLGADAALVVTPYYNKPTSEGLYRHFAQVANESPIPIIIYNIQGRTAKNLETSTLKKLAEIPNIIGVKEASGSIEQGSDVILAVQGIRPDFAVLSGDDSLSLPLIALGACGVVSVVSNLIPKEINSFIQAALEGDFETARKHHFDLLPLFRASFLETNPIPIKAAMNLCGIPVGGYRLPLCEMEPHNLEKLQKTLQHVGLL